MIESLIALLVVIIVVGIIAALVVWMIDMLPVDARFKQIARVLVMLIAVLVVLMRALPLLGVSASPANAEDCCRYRATVESCYDGDTCTMSVYLGLRVSIIERIRLARINAPEVRGDERPAGLVARDWLRERIVGQEVILVTDHDGRGSWGRPIGEVLLDGLNVSDALVAEGHAEYVDY